MQEGRMSCLQQPELHIDTASAQDSDEDGEDQGVSLKRKPKKGKPEKVEKNRKILVSDSEMETVDEDDDIIVMMTMMSSLMTT
jgi:hypothetical protein